MHLCGWRKGEEVRRVYEERLGGLEGLEGLGGLFIYLSSRRFAHRAFHWRECTSIVTIFIVLRFKK